LKTRIKKATKHHQKWPEYGTRQTAIGLFVWLVADGWCWFVLREKYCWLVAGG
jgi:hypothetical protein